MPAPSWTRRSSGTQRPAGRQSTRRAGGPGSDDVGILKKNPPGVVLSGEFDRTSPTVNDELTAFRAQLAELQTRQGFTTFIEAVKQDGDLVTVHIVPAKAGARAPKPAPGVE